MSRSSLLLCSIFLCSILTLSVACSDNGPLEPAGPADVPISPQPQTEISDAVHGVGGNQGFYWLPPMVGDPGGFTGEFNGVLSPTVEICEWDGVCVTQVATFTMETGPGSETIRVVPEDKHYIVNWHTDDEAFDISPGTTYRITAHAADTELGIADVELGATAGEVKNLSTGEMIGLLNGRTLPIKFRIEQGAAAFKFDIPAATGGTVDALDGDVTIDIPAGALQGDTEITVEPVDPIAGAISAVDLGPDGTQFPGNPVTVTLAYDVNALGGVAETDLALNLLDEATGEWNIVPNFVLDTQTKRVSAPFFHFSKAGVGPAAKAVVCPGDGNPNTFDTFDAAIAALMVGGTLTVCDGTHTISLVRIVKGLTIEGKVGTLPTITTGGARFGFVTAFPSGTVTIRNLRLETDWDFDGGASSGSALLIQGAHDQVVVEDVEFDVLPGLNGTVPGSGVIAAPSGVPGAHITLRNVTQTGGRNGVFVWTTGGPTGVSIDIVDSSFDSQRGVTVFDQSSGGGFSDVNIDNVSITADLGVFGLRTGDGSGGRINVSNSSFDGGAAIWFQSGASGTIQNNTSNCGHNGACIRIGGPNPGQTQPDPPRIIGNTITATGVNQTQRGIWVSLPSTGSFEVTGNQVGGPAPSGDRTDPAVYSFPLSGIRIDDPQTPGDVSGNLVSSAYYGITTDGGSAKVTGLDNTVDAVWTALQVVNGGQMSIQSSDLTDYIIPIDATEPFGAGDLTCNWWGDANGPVGVDPSVASGVFTPWATNPVAGTGTISC